MAWVQEKAKTVDASKVESEINTAHKKGRKKIKDTAKSANPETLQGDMSSLVLKAGNQYFKLVAVKETNDLEGIIKEEYETKLKDEVTRIESECTRAMDEFKSYGKTVLEQATSELRQIKERIAHIEPMPEITLEHAKMGLSLVKDESIPGVYHWLFHTVYAPEFLSVDHQQRLIKASLRKKMVTPMIIRITTKGKSITGVDTRTLDLQRFRHYHRHGSSRNNRNPGSDCWGAWKRPSSWSTVDDILAVGRQAASVLSVINTSSPATRAPAGLPRLDTLRNSATRVVEATPTPTTPQSERSGADNVARQRGGWTAR